MKIAAILHKCTALNCANFEAISLVDGEKKCDPEK